jgi:peptide methionine sulfoxide reductase MsrB
MQQTFWVELSNKSHAYQNPYPSHFDLVPYPVGWLTSDIVKFNGEDNRTTWEHVSQHLAQLGEVGSIDALKVHLFPLSLTGTTFSWFSSLSSNSIDSWEQLERKFHDHFYSLENELKLSDLTSVRKGHDELDKDYIRIFRNNKNRCINLMISEKDMAFNGLCSYIREKPDGHTLITLSQLQQKVSAQESQSKENKDNFKHTYRNVNYVNCDSDSSSDKSNEVYAAEFCWPSKAKSYACDSVKLVHKNWQEEIKFTFDVALCDKIFDELHKAGCIRLSHTIPPLAELTRKAYCRWHNSFSPATNDCNIFYR